MVVHNYSEMKTLIFFNPKSNDIHFVVYAW